MRKKTRESQNETKRNDKKDIYNLKKTGKPIEKTGNKQNGEKLPKKEKETTT